MTGPEQSPFAAGLHMTAGRLEKDAAWLRAQADGEQQEWDQFGDPADTILRLERERDEALAEVARMREELRVLRADMADADLDDIYQVEDMRERWVLRLDAVRAHRAGEDA